MGRRLALAALALAACARPALELPLGSYTVHLEPDRGAFSISRQDGSTLVDALAEGGEGAPRGIAFRAVIATIEQELGSYRVSEPEAPWRIVDGLSDVVLAPTRVRFRLDGVDGQGLIELVDEGRLAISLHAPGMTRSSLALRARPGEHFLGCGAHTQDLDHRGATVTSWVSEQGIGQTESEEPSAAWFLLGTRHQTYFPVPFYVSSAGYGLQVDDDRRSLFAFASEDPERVRVEAWADTLPITIFDGPSLPEVLERRTAVVGRPPVPPAWAFSPWGDAIFDSANVRRVATLLRERHIPSGAIWSEDWAGGYMEGQGYALPYEWRVDRGRYPDVEALAAELHRDGFRFLAYFNTFAETDASHFAEVRDLGYLVRRADGGPYLVRSPRFKMTGILDLSNADARGYLAQRMHAALDLGFDGWMADYGEWLPTDGVLASGQDALAAHNAYPVEWQRLNEAVLDARADADRLLSFVRSGYTASAGVKHQVVWGGDQLVSFRPDDGLPTVIPLGLGLGLSGLPYYGSDIAGYTNIDGGPPRSKALFFRWTSLGALSVIMRTHHGIWPQQNWDFERDEETLAHFGRWSRVHVRLYPYLRALAEEATRRGQPIMRPLALGFPDEDAAYTEKSELLLGPALLVAPVLEDEVREREVYLPRARFVPLRFDEQGAPTRAGDPLEGGRRVRVGAPLTELPIFARAGTIVPLLPEAPDTLGPVEDGRGIVGLAQLGARRALLVTLGEAPVAAAEDDLGGRYTLTAAGVPGDAPAFAWADAALAPCVGDEPACVVSTGPGEARLRLSGSGDLELGEAAIAARLEVRGRAAGARLDLVLVW